jgi:hypothetical protein
MRHYLLKIKKLEVEHLLPFFFFGEIAQLLIFPWGSSRFAAKNLGPNVRPLVTHEDRSLVADVRKGPGIHPSLSLQS